MTPLTEEDIRAYIKCSEFKAFGGKVELPIKTMAIEFTYIRQILEYLRLQETFDFQFSLNQTLYLAKKELELNTLTVAEREEILRHTSLYAAEIFDILKPAYYVPVFGPFNYIVNIGKSNLQLDVAAILATGNRNKLDNDPTRVFHAVTFSPYSDPRDMKNDIIQRVKLLTLSMANPFKTFKDKPRIKLHIFGTGSTKEINYAALEYQPSMNRKVWANYLESIAVNIENKYHYPVVPCNYKCPFKSKCEVDPERNNNE